MCLSSVLLSYNQVKVKIIFKFRIDFFQRWRRGAKLLAQKVQRSWKRHRLERNFKKVLRAKTLGKKKTKKKFFLIRKEVHDQKISNSRKKMQ